MSEFLDKFLTYGYLIVFIYSLGGGMIALGALAVFSSNANVDPLIATSTAALGNFLGAELIFYLCKHNKKEFSKQLNTHKRKVALLVIWFRKSGLALTLVCKFLYGFKTIAPIAAELAKLSFLRYSIYNAISCIIWAPAVFFVASYLSESLIKYSDKFSNLYFLGAFIALLAVVALIILKLTRKSHAK